MWHEFVHGLRKARGEKLSSTLFVLLLTIGLSTTAVVGGFLNSVVLKSLPVRDPDSLLLLEKNEERQVRPDTTFSYRQFQAIRQRRDLFSDAIAQQAGTGTSPLRLQGDQTVTSAKAIVVSPNYFSGLGLHAVAGRLLTEADDHGGSPIPVLFSSQFMQAHFPHANDILGKQFRLSKVPVVVVGVVPHDFHSLDVERAPDVWLPTSAVQALDSHPVDDVKEDGKFGYQVLVRLAPGVGKDPAARAMEPPFQAEDEWSWRQRAASFVPPMAAVEVAKIAQSVRDYHLALVPAGHGLSQLRDKFSRALYLLAAASAVLWLMVCTSIGGLLLVKGAARSRELSIRLALGATRSRIVRELFLENLSLVILSLTLSFWLAYPLSALVLGLLPEVRSLDQQLSPKIISIAPDMAVGLFVLALSLISVLACGLIPAARAKLNLELVGAPVSSFRKTPGLLMLLAAQIALATVLLTFAALFLRTFWGLAHTPPGFDAAHILEFALDLKDTSYSDAQAGSFLANLEAQVSSLPAVRSVAFSSVAVMRGIGFKATMAPQGVVLPRSTFLNTSLNAVTPGYFETMGIPLLQGRNLRQDEMAKKPQPMVVNRAFAQAFFPGQNAVGKLMAVGRDGTEQPEYEIVGVVETAKYRSIREQNAPVYYVAMDIRNRNRTVYLYLRTSARTEQISNQARAIVEKLSPGLPFLEVATLEQRVQNSLWQERLITLLSGVFAIAALILGAAGIYGALAHSIARRVRELGIRMALGAGPWQMARTVYWQIVIAVSLGLAAGTAMALFLVRFAAALLYAVNALDVASFASAIGMVVLGALTAGIHPTWHLFRIQPLAALRDE
jgi:predicted permease